MVNTTSSCPDGYVDDDWLMVKPILCATPVTTQLVLCILAAVYAFVVGVKIIVTALHVPKNLKVVAGLYTTFLITIFTFLVISAVKGLKGDQPGIWVLWTLFFWPLLFGMTLRVEIFMNIIKKAGKLKRFDTTTYSRMLWISTLSWLIAITGVWLIPAVTTGITELYATLGYLFTGMSTAFLGIAIFSINHKMVKILEFSVKTARSSKRNLYDGDPISTSDPRSASAANPSSPTSHNSPKRASAEPVKTALDKAQDMANRVERMVNIVNATTKSSCIGLFICSTVFFVAAGIGPRMYIIHVASFASITAMLGISRFFAHCAEVEKNRVNKSKNSKGSKSGGPVQADVDLSTNSQLQVGSTCQV